MHYNAYTVLQAGLYKYITIHAICEHTQCCEESIFIK